MIKLQIKRVASAALVVAASLSLSACFWDSGDDNVTVAAADLSVPAAATTLAAVANTAYTFPAVAAFGTTTATTVSFTSTTATPAFSIASSEGTATGTTTFGSCIFTVTASTFPAGHPLATGAVVTVNPCELKVLVKGVEAGATGASLGTQLKLGTLTSATVTKEGSISATGNVVIGGATLGTVSVVVSTGATGGGN